MKKKRHTWQTVVPFMSPKTPDVSAVIPILAFGNNFCLLLRDDNIFLVVS